MTRRLTTITSLLAAFALLGCATEVKQLDQSPQRFFVVGAPEPAEQNQTVAKGKAFSLPKAQTRCRRFQKDARYLYSIVKDGELQFHYRCVPFSQS